MRHLILMCSVEYYIFICIRLSFPRKQVTLCLYLFSFISGIRQLAERQLVERLQVE